MTQGEIDRTFRKTLQTQEFNFELIRNHEMLDVALTAMGDDINGKIREMFGEIKDGEKVTSVRVTWTNVPEKLHNPDRNIGYWRVEVAKLKQATQ